MKERGISFTAVMADQVHHGAKTQTRRPVKVQSPFGFNHPRQKRGQGWRWYEKKQGGGGWPEKGIWCPYGWPGQALWVREPFWKDDVTQAVRTYHGCLIPGSSVPGCTLLRPTMMSRGQSRTLLQVTEIRMQKASDISERDAIEEGFTDVMDFKDAWETIYGKEDPSPWVGDPWVWAVSFKVLSKSAGIPS